MSDFNTQEYSGSRQIFSEGLENGRKDAESGRFPVEFPVDISRDEFVRFNVIVSKQGGALSFQKGQLGFVFAIAVISLFMLISDFINYNRIDPLNIMTIVFAAVFSAMLSFSFSHRVKNSAENTYDLNLQSGRSYYGIVSVYPDRIEKQNESASVSIDFAEASYTETQEMMIISAFNKPHIVLPARCLTPDDAEAVRRAVFASVPVTRQRIVSKFLPAAKEHISRPEHDAIIPQADEEAISVDVSYTREEFVKMAVDSALRNYLKFLPFYSVMSLTASVMLGFLFNFGIGIAVYIIFNAGLIGFNLFNSKSRSAMLYDQLTPPRFTAYFTKDGIDIRLQRGGGRASFKWDSVTRAVERPDSLDFYTKSLFFRIPKRCVGDLSELKEFVNNHFKKGK